MATEEQVMLHGPWWTTGLHSLLFNGTIVEHDPFVSVMLGVGPAPSTGAYSLFSYWVTLCLFSPSMFNVLGLTISLLTKEWGAYMNNRAELRRQAWLTSKGLVLSTPVLAVMMRAILEQRVGRLRYDDDNIAWPEYIFSAIAFILVQDTTFYLMHRLWHTELLYDLSHHLHHSCRPTTTFAASAADVFEITFTGYVSALMPALVVPMGARLFLIMDLFGHLWSIYLHNHDAHRIGLLVYDPHDHNVHHYYGQRNFNFGLYTQIPDRIMGTFKAFTPTGRLSLSKKLE
ncbi:hypothetical protein PTSG_01052 [Salpingoeca rosetta]|uniref:Fatty acid hydroxylase domain-containing protein n=1 Tax=Salpingoeca rosetta (strain ATCC 50818 / BSB-021) TaxID=946362 RepID=F2TY93_SALR5|nr:uncharacterized protein PTSG_01052 [Salpingoeca rosetta]EGD76352.1 hypothetical protein PTSG_01052 [Salpingoeca rosetta]|eukprot:XP_004998527.1 hypothetical protein PTSG_01052 [Salpingoeca rosetta]